MNSVEIDFLQVESGDKSGDAITFRYGNLSYPYTQTVIIIDGGTINSGKNLVSHINNMYGTNTVDLVICTHPDADHVSGLREVLKNCEVKELWIHKPWEHSAEICDLFHDGRITSNSLGEKIRDEYNYAYELVQIANSKNITIKEPFEGLTYDGGVITILGPSRKYYQSLIPEFAKTPDAKTLAEKAYAEIKNVFNRVLESINVETLDETGVTSSENSSSAITLLTIDYEYFLFTGDAGIISMHNAVDAATTRGIDLSNVRFLQVPHHGSKRNISPSVLDRVNCKVAFISASQTSKKHPSKRVTNALKRRGAEVFTTQPRVISHNLNGLMRMGYGPLAPLPFYNEFEE